MNSYRAKKWMPAQVGSITGGVHTPAIRNGADLPGNQSSGGTVTIERSVQYVQSERRAGLAVFFGSKYMPPGIWSTEPKPVQC